MFGPDKQHVMVLTRVRVLITPLQDYSTRSTNWKQKGSLFLCINIDRTSG